MLQTLLFMVPSFYSHCIYVSWPSPYYPRLSFSLSHLPTTHVSLPIRGSSVLSSWVLAFSAALIPLWCVCHSALHLPLGLCVFVCVFVLCTPFIPGLWAVNPANTALITVNNKSLRALREEFISLMRLSFLSFFSLTL